MKQIPKTGKLTVQLYENVLSDKKETYFGKITIRGSVTTAELADMLVNSGIGFTKEQILEISSRLADAALDCVAEGFSVRLDTCTLRASISGVFTGANSSFDANQHTIGVTFSASQRCRAAIKQALVVVKGLAPSCMAINRVYDVKSGEVNGLLTCGRPLKIYGTSLVVEGDNPAVGIWFVNVSDETIRVPVEDGDLVDNTLSQLTVVIPNLSTGEWYVEVATQGSKNKGRWLKEVRTTRFEVPLAVI